MIAELKKRHPAFDQMIDGGWLVVISRSSWLLVR
jgi:hypothetical protein